MSEAAVETTNIGTLPAKDRRRRLAASPPPRLGPYSRAIDRGALGLSISGVSREGRYLRAYEKMLIDYLGDSVDPITRQQIVRCARLALHLELLDEQTLAQGKPLTEHDYNHYVAWSNALSRTLARLGIKTNGLR